MLTIKFGNILDVKHGFIVHGCNSKGVMGSGIAKQVKEKYPEAFKQYNRFCLQNSHKDILGHTVSVQVAEPMDSPPLIICNAITQLGFGQDGSRYVNYKAVQTAFVDIALAADSMGLEVHYPLIGAGLGGGDWSVISSIIDQAFEPYQVSRTLWLIE